jgi:tetratricopeptide (TPR) repeat protein
MTITRWSATWESVSVSVQNPVQPVINSIYQAYLDHEDGERFNREVRERYFTATLERLAESGGVQTRRGAALAIGHIGNYSSNAVLGRLMRDDDRCVRVIAENGIRDLWMRDGNDKMQARLAEIVELNLDHKFADVVTLASTLIDDAPFFAEVWNQRAIALYQLKEYDDSANDCHQTLEINPYHFGAAVGMGHCYLEQGDGFGALDCFRRAIRLNPDMEEVRAQVEYLERMLEKREDR